MESLSQPSKLVPLIIIGDSTEKSALFELLVKSIKQSDRSMFESCMKEDHSLAWSAKIGSVTPLHVAAEFGRDWFVRELIETYKADVNMQCNLTGYTPLMYSC